MLVADTLLVDSDSLNSQEAFFLGQETSIELVIRHEIKEEASNNNSQESSDQEDNLPRLDRRTMSGSTGNAIGHQSAYDLSPAIEGKPDAGTQTLFFLCVPLGREQSETRRDRRFKDA